MVKSHGFRLASREVLMGLVAGVMLTAWATSARANAPLTVPSTNTFEQYAVGTKIVDENGVGVDGWYWAGNSYSSAIAVVTADVAPRDNVMSFANPVSPALSNVFDTSVYGGYSQGGATGTLLSNVVIDCWLQAGYLDSAPQVGLDTQVGAYVNTNGHLVIRHATYSLDYATFDRAWTELNNTPLASNEWFHLTITMDYLAAWNATGEKFFKVQVNDTTLTNDAGWPTIPIVDINMPRGGQWFMCANSGSTATGAGYQAGPDNPFFSGLALIGKGSIDDIAINSTGGGGEQPKPSIRLTGVSRTGQTALLQWTNTNPDVTSYQCEVWRSTNLLMPNGGWSRIQDDYDGEARTTTWTDTNGLPTPLFYQIRVPVP